VISAPPAASTIARTVAISDPGSLQKYLVDDTSVAWIRRGEGMIGLGCYSCTDVAGAAEADAWWNTLLEGLEHTTQLPGLTGTGPLAFGSFTFDPEQSAGVSRLLVPRVIIGRRSGHAWLTVVGDGDLELPEPGSALRAPKAVRVVADEEAERRWCRRVAEAVARIERNGLEKVVLARSVTARAAEPLDVRHLVDTLARDYPSCWTYAVDGLVGASPEMLVRRERGLATSRILAGTIRRSGWEETDLKLASSLARSSKNLAEHELAVASVAEALAPLCSGMNVPESPYVLELPNVLHLATDVTAVAHEDASSLRLAAALHPSAAVCGTPTSVARAAIAELEGLDRGRYSGPVGWIDADGDGEWAIALRCGMVDRSDPSAIELFAGCGIVEGSDPAEELAETKAKLVPMIDALVG